MGAQDTRVLGRAAWVAGILGSRDTEEGGLGMQTLPAGTCCRLSAWP